MFVGVQVNRGSGSNHCVSFRSFRIRRTVWTLDRVLITVAHVSDRDLSSFSVRQKIVITAFFYTTNPHWRFDANLVINVNCWVRWIVKTEFG